MQAALATRRTPGETARVGSECSGPGKASPGVALRSFSCGLAMTPPRAPGKVGAHPHREAWWGAHPHPQTRPNWVVSPAEAQSCLLGNSQQPLKERKSLRAARLLASLPSLQL